MGQAWGRRLGWAGGMQSEVQGWLERVGRCHSHICLGKVQGVPPWRSLVRTLHYVVMRSR